MRWSARTCLLGSLWLPACSEGDSHYRKVAEGRYTTIWQSLDLDGRVCPEGAAETDRQIDELASSLRVSVPDDFRVIAWIEPSTDVVQEKCGNLDVSGCILTADDPAGSPIVISPQYLMGHEAVHAVQRLRDGWPHAALREGEARMFEDFADSLGPFGICGPQPVSESRIREALDDPLGTLGSYSVFHEMVARVYQDYGPEAFDALWVASAADPTTEGLLSAFEAVLDTTLFELMQQPSATCRNQSPGCAGLERMFLTSNALTVRVPTSCDEATSGLEPGDIYRSFVLELEEPGDLTVAFSDANGYVNVGACDGFNDELNFASFTAAFDRGAYPLEAGLYRVLVVGNSDGPSGEARFEFMPTG